MIKPLKNIITKVLTSEPSINDKYNPVKQRATRIAKNHR